jgi:hypothetical protein
MLPTFLILISKDGIQSHTALSGPGINNIVTVTTEEADSERF